MEKSTGRSIRLGIMVITGAILFTLTVYLIGQKQDMFSNTFTLRTIFNNVNGLQPGNNVRFSGINIGSVVSVTIQSDSTIEVTMRIRENVQPYIKKNAIVTIGTDGLMGNMLVNIIPGASPAPPVENNDMLKTYSRIKTDDILRTLNVTNENAALLTANLLEVMQEIKHGKGTVSYLIYDTTLRKELSQAVYNLRSATAKTNHLLMQIQDIGNRVEEGEGLAGWLLKDTITSQQVNQTLVQLQKASEEIHHTADSLKTFIGNLNAGKGMLPTLMYDTTMIYDLRQTLRNLNSGTAKFDENMEAFKHNFLTRGYFKKQEKNKK